MVVVLAGGGGEIVFSKGSISFAKFVMFGQMSPLSVIFFFFFSVKRFIFFNTVVPFSLSFFLFFFTD